MECRTLSRHSSLGSEAVMSVLYNAHSTQRMLSVAREMDIDPTFHKAKNTRTHKRSRSIACTWHAHSTRTHTHTQTHTHTSHTHSTHKDWTTSVYRYLSFNTDLCYIRLHTSVENLHSQNHTKPTGLPRQDTSSDFKVPLLIAQRERSPTRKLANTKIAVSRRTLHRPAQWCTNRSTVMRERIGGRGAAL